MLAWGDWLQGSTPWSIVHVLEFILNASVMHRWSSASVVRSRNRIVELRSNRANLVGPDVSEALNSERSLIGPSSWLSQPTCNQHPELLTQLKFCYFEFTRPPDTLTDNSDNGACPRAWSLRLYERGIESTECLNSKQYATVKAQTTGNIGTMSGTSSVPQLPTRVNLGLTYGAYLIGATVAAMCVLSS
jgi:hypothetical protein